MKLISEYLEHARQFERLAAAETNPKAKKQMQDQAEAYHKLAKMRAVNLGLPMPPAPPQSK